MADRDQYLSDTSQALLAVQQGLIGAFPAPSTVAELAQHTGASRDQVYRSLRNLEHAGCAEETPRGWMIGPQLAEATARMQRQTAQILAHYRVITD
jgi:DNA-binding IclR family transcriptional regulator